MMMDVIIFLSLRYTVRQYKHLNVKERATAHAILTLLKLKILCMDPRIPSWCLHVLVRQQ